MQEPASASKNQGPSAPQARGPREPEIEILGRLAHRALIVLRLALSLAGAAALIAAVWLTLDPRAPADGLPIAPLAERIAHNLVLVCAGLPLLLPVRWLFGRGRWPALAAGALLWFGPMALDGDHTYGFVIRGFASFVACATLLVHRTLSSLRS